MTMSAARRELAGKTALVTGGAHGIGRGIAEALAAEGAQVAICDIDAEGARRAAQDIGGAAIGLDVDVSDLEAFTRAFEVVEAEVGPLEVMVNNAGILPVGRFDEEPDELTARQLDVMLRGMVHGTKQAVRRMKPRGRGHIFNISSVGGWMPGAGAVTYSAAKFGVRGMSEALRMELHGTGVEISVVGPGVVETDMTAGLKRFRGVRVATPADVGAAVVRTYRRPKFAVFVPQEMVVGAMAYSALPYRLRFGVVRAIGADRTMLDVDMTARAAYDDRVKSSAGPPSLKP